MRVVYRLFLILAMSVAPVACGSAQAADPPAAAPQPKTTLLLVQGAPGEESYAKVFTEELAQWRKTAAGAAVELHVVGDAADRDESATDKTRLEQLLRGIL